MSRHRFSLRCRAPWHSRGVQRARECGSITRRIEVSRKIEDVGVMPGTLVVNPDKTFIGILEQRHAHLPLLSEPMPPDFQTAVQIAVLFIFGFRQFGGIVLDVRVVPITIVILSVGKSRKV